MPWSRLLPLILVGAAWSVGAASEVPLDACRDLAAWRFSDGGEFPGAKGSLAVGSEGIDIGYDFSGGGSYVAAEYVGPFPPEVIGIDASVSCDRPCAVGWRWRDATGRVHQGAGCDVPAGGMDLRVERAGPWATAWGGPADAQAEQPGDPVA